MEQPWVVANQRVTVHCEARDARGNPLPQVTTAFSVRREDSDAVDPAGFTAVERGFRATVAGIYLVTCSLPDQDLSDATPAVVQVRPGQPYRWITDYQEVDCMRVGEPLQLSCFVYDAWDNPILDAVIEPVDGAAERVEANGVGGFVVTADGEHDLTFDVAGPKHPDPIIEPLVLSVVVDSTPPSFRLVTPVRGSVVQPQGSDEETVWVEGELVDEVSPIVLASINDHPLEVNGNSRLLPVRVQIPQQWGLNMVYGATEDACGNRATVVQSHLMSSAYAPAGDAQRQDWVRTAVVGALSQELLDDDQDDLDDVATVLSTVLCNLDPNEVLPELLIVSPDEDDDGQIDTQAYDCSQGPRHNTRGGYRVGLDGEVSLGSLRIDDLTVTDDTLSVGLSLQEARVPLSIAATVDLGCYGNPTVPLSAVVGTDAMVLEVTTGVSIVGGDLSAEICPECLEVSWGPTGPWLQADWHAFVDPELMDAAALDALAKAVLDDVLVSIQQTVQTRLARTLPALLEQAISGLAIEHRVSLPSPADVSVDVTGGVEELSLVGVAGHGTAHVALTAHVTPSQRAPGLPAEVMGAIRSGEPSPPDLLPTLRSGGHTFALAINDDLLNQALWAAWYGGALDRDIFFDVYEGKSDDDDKAKATVSALLPPVVVPSHSPDRVKIGLGEVRLRVTIDLARAMAPGDEPTTPSTSGVEPPPPIDVELLIAGFVEGSATVDLEERTLVVTPAPQALIRAEVVSLHDPSEYPYMQHLATHVAAVAIPQILPRQVLTFPLPDLSLDALPGVKEGTAWRLEQATVTRRPGERWFRVAGRHGQVP